ncbi:MAG TPA: aldo/keto reductase [Candidatus Thermoplasmatota archaeon]|nr:aldo/keto reductase [Candidatus Thermoplasmatota archaeon]
MTPETPDEKLRKALARMTFRLGGNLPVPRLGYGAMRLTGKGVWGDPEDREAALGVLHRAVDLGVRLIDTADAYGPHTNEYLIGDAFPRYPDGLVIATKGGLTRPGPGKWVPDGSPRHLHEAIEGSLERLHVDQIDLYQLHSPDEDVPFEDSVGALAEMRDDGLVRHVGLSNVTVEQLDEALDIVPIVSVQNEYNLGERDSEDVLEACEARGIAFIPWFPLGSGELTRPGSPVAKVASRLGATPSQVALAWLLKRSPVMLPIPGTSKVQHLEENLGAVLVELSDEDFETLDGIAAPA